MQELIDSDHDLIIGLGFMVKEDLEAKAKMYPDQQFILVDDVSELPNVTSVTFKEHEGSFLAGVSAALASESGIVGFVGGDDVPLINKFASGFEQGVKSVNRDNEVIIEYAHDFGNVETGTALAREMVTNGANVLYAAAGLTGVGVLTEAQNQGIYSIGVDSDQYFIAEKSVMTSMMKHIDQAVYQVVSSFVEDKKMEDRSVVLGLNEGGVGLAPFRLVDEQAYRTEIERWAQLITNGDLTVQEQRGDN